MTVSDLFLKFVMRDTASPLLLANGTIYAWRDGHGWKPLGDASASIVEAGHKTPPSSL